MQKDTPQWVTDIVNRYVVKQSDTALPPLGRNLQAEIGRVQAVIDVVSKNSVPASEAGRLRAKVQDLMNILDAIKNPP